MLKVKKNFADVSSGNCNNDIIAVHENDSIQKKVIQLLIMMIF